MVLGAWSGVNSSPAVLAVVAETVDVATKVGGIAAIATYPLTLVTCLIIQHVWFHLNLVGRNRVRQYITADTETTYECTTSECHEVIRPQPERNIPNTTVL